MGDRRKAIYIFNRIQKVTFRIMKTHKIRILYNFLKPDLTTDIPLLFYYQSRNYLSSSSEVIYRTPEMSSTFVKIMFYS